jgi:hypothetical protein
MRALPIQAEDAEPDGIRGGRGAVPLRRGVFKAPLGTEEKGAL